MSPEAFIEDALAAGQRDGVAALDADQRLVFLVSEAEVLCDMEGIDAFLGRYAPDWLAECARGFEEAGALEIAAGLRAVPPDAPADNQLLDRLSQLITSRTGYDYKSLRRVVQDRLSKRFT